MWLIVGGRLKWKGKDVFLLSLLLWEDAFHIKNQVSTFSLSGANR